MKTFLLTCALAATSSAALGSVTYIETTDISNNQLAPTLITPALGIGLNTVSGTLPVQPGTFPRPDVDFFRVTLPNTYSISSISIDVTNYVGVTGSGNFGGLLMINTVTNAGNTGAAYFYGNSSVSLNFTLADPNNIVLLVSSPNNGFPNFEAGSADYTVNINVIPAPSVFAIAGLFGLGAIRRRR